MLFVLRLKYICGMYFIVMALAGPIDVVFDIGVIEFFTSWRGFILFPIFWFLAPLAERFVPFR